MQGSARAHSRLHVDALDVACRKEGHAGRAWSENNPWKISSQAAGFAGCLTILVEHPPNLALGHPEAKEDQGCTSLLQSHVTMEQHARPSTHVYS